MRDLPVAKPLGTDDRGRRRALEASLTGGPDQPSYDEHVLATAKRLMEDWSELWSKATPKQRADIVSAAFDEVRVKDKAIVSATLARPEYVALVATSEAARDGLSWHPRTGAGRLLPVSRRSWRPTRRWRSRWVVRTLVIKPTVCSRAPVVPVALCLVSSTCCSRRRAESRT